MFFACRPESLGLHVGDSVDVLFNIDVNEWKGRRSVQFIVRDIKYSESRQNAIVMEEQRFLEIWNGAKFTPEENVLPMRDDFAAVYRMIVASVRCGADTLGIRDILFRLSHTREGAEIGYVKLHIIIKVMQELNLMGINEIEKEKYQFSIHYRSSKTELDKSNLLRRIRSQQIIAN